MSSKAAGQHQQGRRTPLSLTGGKHSQQQQNNKNNSKNQETKSEANVSAKNGNNNPTKNQETNQTQKELKKSQQNGSNGEQNLKKTMDKIQETDDDVIFVEQNGKSNGHNNKNNVDATKKIETEKTKEKQQKNETNKTSANEKKQNEVVEKEKDKLTTTTNSPKSKDGTSTPTTPIAAPATQSNEKKQTPSSATKANENIQKSATPTKQLTANEKGRATPPTKSPANKHAGTPSKSPKGQKKNAPEEVDVFDEEMAPLVIDNSPSKKVSASITPAATSTPGKVSNKRNSKAKAEIQKSSQEEKNSVDPKAIPRSFSQISGRRSIRPIDDFTPSMYNTQFRESYRRINTELDVTGNTNTSMNVTVGSEIPNNSSFLSFSLFGRGRKRERTSPLSVQTKSQSAVELSTETTPPKRARLDMHGIFTAMSSPLTLLRTRFSKTTLESSTPAKGKETNAVEDDVQNVSGVSIEEVFVSSSGGNNTDVTATGDNITVGKEAIANDVTPTKSTPGKEQKTNEDGTENSKSSDTNAAMDIDDDIKIKETPIIPAVGDAASGKQRGCIVM